MCGIAGIQTERSFGSISSFETVLNSMAEKLIHRGPDDSGIYIDGAVGLAHRRLSIIDLQTGHQPMLNRTSDIAVVFNGEIFNYLELRADMERKGHRFCSQSDTEVIIELYAEHGLDFVHKLNGQFAIAIWDRRKRRLVLIRDRVGICPLYYTSSYNGLFFASEIKALAPAISSPLEFDSCALDQIFTFWSPVSPRTMFKGIKELSPGTMLVSENGSVTVTRYWDWDFPDVEFLTDPIDEIADTLKELLIDATRIRLRSDVPVGAYLSGGLDSSVLVSMIHNHGSVPLRSFSLTFDEEDYDERGYQAELIKFLGAKHSSLNICNDDLSDHLVDTVWHTESPILRTAPVPMGLLSGLVRKSGFKVVLTGEGADEVLGGYDLFKEAKIRQFWARYPDSESRPLLLKRLYPYLQLPKQGQASYLKRFFGEGIQNPGQVLFSHLPRWSTTAQAKRFFSRDLIASIREPGIETMLKSLPPGLEHKHAFNRAQFIEAKSLMAGYLLSSQGDRMLMKNSVEGRFPFLDHRVIEYANRIPPKFKMRGLNEKYVLKKAMADDLPGDIVKRHKQPYRAPDVKASVGNRISPKVRHYVEEQALQNAGLFDPKKVSMLTRKAETVKGLNVSESQAFIGILTTQILHSRYCQ